MLSGYGSFNISLHFPIHNYSKSRKYSYKSKATLNTCIYYSFQFIIYDYNFNFTIKYLPSPKVGLTTQIPVGQMPVEEQQTLDKTTRQIHKGTGAQITILRGNASSSPIHCCDVTKPPYLISDELCTVCVHRVLSAHRAVLLCAQNTQIRRSGRQ